MDHRDHVGLLRGGVTSPGGTWADIGAGRGAFTLALADLLGDGAHVIAIDRDAGALADTTRAMGDRFPSVQLTTLVADLEGHLALPPLDGMVAANSLHYVPPERQVDVVRTLTSHLRRAAPLIVVEYDADRGNPAVPHPFSSRRWREIAANADLVDTVEIGRVPSRFLGAIYSAVSRRR
jgi:SAM-dependent methyltransferase